MCLEIGVDVVAIPIERIVFHAQVVARKVAGRIAEVVVLIPKDSLGSRRSRHNVHLDRQVDGRPTRLVLPFTGWRLDGERHVTLRQSFPLGRLARHTSREKRKNVGQLQTT